MAIFSFYSLLKFLFLLLLYSFYAFSSSSSVDDYDTEQGIKNRDNDWGHPHCHLFNKLL